MIPGMFSTMIGGLPQINITINSDVNDYNLFVAAGSPATPVVVTLTIDTGVIVAASSQTKTALRVPSFPSGSEIKIINNGYIIGHGGDGGVGAGSNQPSPSPGVVGSDAISIGCNVAINNTNGYIFGGGSGGAGGNKGLSVSGSTLSPNYNTLGGGGGGGGQGAGISSGAPGGGPQGHAGADGNLDGPGVGGTAVIQQGSGSFAGHTYKSEAGQPGSPWGVGGSYAVRVNGHAITWLGGYNADQVKGNLS